MDPLQWMGAVKMRVQTAHKNITIINQINPHDSTPSINVRLSELSEKLCVCNKQIHHKVVLILNRHFWPQYKSVIH